MKTYRVYVIKDRSNEKVVYVGLTGQTIYKRFIQHVSRRKISPKDFFIELAQDDLSLPEAITLEEMLIEQYATRSVGWNVSPKSSNGYSNTHSEEYKLRMRWQNIGRGHTEKTRLKMSQTRKGRPHSERHRQALSDAIPRKPVICMNDGRTYQSITEAANALGLSISKVSLVVNGIRPHTQGYKFRYL